MLNALVVRYYHLGIHVDAFIDQHELLDLNHKVLVPK
jgi:hypothetical protein